MSQRKRHSLATFLLELLVYTALVFVYLAVVMNSLSSWVSHLHEHHKRWYAFLAIGLIIGQAVLLETVATMVVRWVGKKGG